MAHARQSAERTLPPETGTWEYDASSKSLSITTYGHEPQRYEVVEASAKKLVMTHRVEARSETHVLTATYAVR